MNTPTPVAPVLTPNTLTHPKEKTYFTFVLLFSILVWLIVVITIFGLLYAALFAVMIWLVHQAKTPRRVPDKWRQEQRQKKRNNAEKDEGDHN